MIYTLTLNAAIDMNISTDNLNPNSVNRTNEVCYSPNGKGVNVSLVMKHFGIKNNALIIAGGFTGKYIVDELQKKEQSVYPFWVEEPTRINVFINNIYEEYKIVSPGAFVNDKIKNKILEYLKSLNDIELLIISGSLPPGLNEDIYFKIVDICNEKNIPFIVDISSPILKKIINKKPYLIKPNDEEIKNIFGYKTDNEKYIIEAIKEIHNEGAENILLTMGDKGLYFSNKKKIYYCDTYPVKLVSSACSGDSCLASFIAGLKNNLTIEENLKRASATGANVAESHGIGKLECVEEYSKKLKVKEVLL